MELVNLARIIIQSGEDVTSEVMNKASVTCDSHVSSQMHTDIYMQK